MSQNDDERLARIVHGRRQTAKILPALLTHSQTLSSGMTVRQNFHECSRPVLFVTGLEGFEYATGGGTLLVARFLECFYAVTCAHVFKEFDWVDLIIPDSHLGIKGVGPTAACLPNKPTGDAIGSDIVDLCVLRLPPDMNPNFFGRNAYIIDLNTVCSSATGDSLMVSGVLKGPSRIAPPNIHSAHAILEFTDTGPRGDPFLREAAAVIDPPPEFDRLTGLSGAPVYNMKRKALCGMVMRGGMTGTQLSAIYMEIAHIVTFLEAISEERPTVNYSKLRSRPS